MTQPDFERARTYALTRLEQELPAFLVYHSVAHTRDSVVPSVERLAMHEGIDGEELLLLRTAAWFHDIGFVEQSLDHEALGVRTAALCLPQWGYTRTQIALIGGMIMSTKLPQSPQTKLEAILADADLDVLGRSNFLERNNDLRTELAALGTHSTDEEWYNSQLRFLETHRYWTQSARSLRDGGKQRNIAALAALCKQTPLRDA